MVIDYDIRSKQRGMERIIKETFYTTDFYKKQTRKTMKEILSVLEPHVIINNPYAFRGMSKKRMMKHIECYILLHNLKCDISITYFINHRKEI